MKLSLEDTNLHESNLGIIFNYNANFHNMDFTSTIFKKLILSKINLSNIFLC
ncbi:MAG: pentapeptide repeat-containing protein [cyanobacterium endosymbiont of Rhopalodia inflata]